MLEFQGTTESPALRPKTPYVIVETYKLSNPEVSTWVSAGAYSSREDFVERLEEFYPELPRTYHMLAENVVVSYLVHPTQGTLYYIDIIVPGR